MPYYKCCIPGCDSLRQDARLHSFPVNADRLKKWIKHIPDETLKRKRPVDFAHMQVCHKHYESRFISKKFRLLKNAYPTLFSETEIKTGNPQHPQEDKENDLADDYGRKRQHDHPYCKDPQLHTGPLRTGIKDSSSNEGTSEPPVERPMGETSEEVCTQPMDLNKQTNEPDLDALGSPSPSHSDVPEPEPMAFSWQNTEHIIVEKDNLDTDNIQPNENAPDSMQDEKCHKTLTEAATREEEYRKEKHTGFSCDYCLGDIVGFRYTCIQCENFDLCAACESRLVHPLHYMLRVSMPKPYNEVRRVITAIRDKLAKLEEDFRQCSVLFDDVLIKKEEDPLVEESVEPLPSVLGEAVQPETVPNVDDSLYGISEEPNTFWLSSKHTTLQNEDCGRSSEDHYVDGSQHRREEPFIKKEYEEEELLDGTWFGESDKDNNRKRRIIVVNKFQRGKMRKPVKSKDVCVNEGRPEQSY
ncbi:uncharacterized protein LOC106143482 isoform X6 [Amyelois transitella]|uniref:uncharacterized protein LOC106143482 isoform X6 n=1 Tax=Amyelois transitella TaxID=680683 RepID=UPI00298F4683|nr:uncharacterized protein LOC106143482 isoform X6 [Amyelois transitella]